MLIREIKIVSFMIPDERAELREFELCNDVRFWQREETSQMVTYIHTSVCTTTRRKDDNK